MPLNPDESHSIRRTKEAWKLPLPGGEGGPVAQDPYREVLLGTRLP